VAEKWRVLVSTRYFDDRARTLLESSGCEVHRLNAQDDSSDENLAEADLTLALTDCSGWIVGLARASELVLSAAPSLRVIARRGVGYDRVNVEAARKLGMVVTIAAGANAGSVADHALALMLGVSKRIPEMWIAMRNGEWTPLPNSDLYGKTVGLVGYGRIGRALAKRLRGFDAKVLVYDPLVGSVQDETIVQVDLARLARESDFVSLHLPLSPKTHHIINETILNEMKNGSIIINTARGGLIDEVALLGAIEVGKLSGAGLDCFECENDSTKLSASNQLIAHPRVLATPHAGGSSREALEFGNRIAAECVLAVLRGESPNADCLIVDGRGRTL
jgi:D-3-phosphoglycerate dehydrogenase / 2-oxoglutarate reductase